jgi:hypothetical protein
MPGLVPGIHVLACRAEDVDGRDKPGHDAESPRAMENYRGGTFVIGLRCASAATVDVPIGPSSS